MSSTKPLVLLTGISGFVGAHVFKALLESGYRVRGAVRSLSKAKYFEETYASQSADFSFVTIPDIQAPGALDDAISDVDYVCHVASPYFISATDPIKELVDPAVNGTKTVLESAFSKAKNLKRVTVLSSFASVVDLEKNPRPGYVYTAKDWDPVTREQAAGSGFYAYHAGKTWAEKAAWDLWRERKPEWDLVTFCPPMIYGPPVHEVDASKGVQGLNTSVKRFLTSILGQDPEYAPKVATPGLPAWVDVRNVAAAHVGALGLDKGVSERFLLCGGVDYFEDGLKGLRERGEKGLGEVGAKVDRKNHFSLDATRAAEAFGISWIPFEKTTEDTWARAKELGLI